MTSYHVNRTGSQRSVGPRRVPKKYTFADLTEVISKSVFGAKRLANKLGEIPVVSRAYKPFTTTIAGTGTATATITISGGFSPYKGTVTLTCNVGSAIVSIPVVNFTRTTTTKQLATGIATALNNRKNAANNRTLEALASGNTVTVTEDGGATVVSLSATIGKA
jgi:hypothetical protein